MRCPCRFCRSIQEEKFHVQFLLTSGKAFAGNSHQRAENHMLLQYKSILKTAAPSNGLIHLAKVLLSPHPYTIIYLYLYHLPPNVYSQDAGASKVGFALNAELPLRIASGQQHAQLTGSWCSWGRSGDVEVKNNWRETWTKILHQLIMMNIPWVPVLEHLN